MNRLIILQRLGLALFFLSGMTGLVYQSAWSHYLGTFLGHAAYAQAAILVIFIGGLGIGGFLGAKVGRRESVPFQLYAILEFAIGIFAIAFHGIFQGATARVITAGDSALAVDLLRFGLATVLLLPPSILLGMTFPLFTEALSKARAKLDGRTIAVSYFANSFGAALGALTSIFVLIPAVGLPGTMLTAGMANVIIGLLLYLGGRSLRDEDLPGEVSAAYEHRRAEPVHLALSPEAKLVLLAAALTGTASFIYEIVWIRLLVLSLGSSLHSFELMLSAFILGIAFGSLAIHGLFPRLRRLLVAAGVVQLLMAAAAAASLLLFDQTFHVVAFFLEALAETDDGYDLYLVATSVVALLVMFPATFFAGMTLPLFTQALAASNHSERSIGQVYAANTIGSIVGVLIAVIVALPLLGLRGSILLGALIDAAVGIALIAFATRGTEDRASAWRPAVVALVAVFTFALVGHVEPRNLASGTFRTGSAEIGEDTTLDFLKHGRTATVSVMTSPDGARTIATNGKPDASVAINGGAAADEPTMVALAVLPLAAHANPETVAVVGFGSGMTTHTVLLDERVQTVDTIEIEPAMIEGARLFLPHNELAYEDPRSAIHIDDAKAFFQRTGTRYDVIVSEPSNPWISGVGGLFSVEFYRLLQNYMTEDGLLVQWLQGYEIDEPLLASVFVALDREFSDYAVFKGSEQDFVIIASRSDRWGDLRETIFAQPRLRAEMEEVGIESLDDLRIRYLGDRELLAPLWRSYGTPANSDYFPVLSLRAPRTRFQILSADGLNDLRLRTPIPIVEATSDDRWAGKAIPAFSPFRSSGNFRRAWQLLDEMQSQAPGEPLLQWLRMTGQDCALLETSLERWRSGLHDFARTTLPLVPSAAAREAWEPTRWSSCPQAQGMLGIYAAYAARDWVAVLEGIESEAGLLDPGPLQQDFVKLAAFAAFETGNAAAARHYVQFIASGPGDLSGEVLRNLVAGMP